jgi:hypothetical protein
MMLIFLEGSWDDLPFEIRLLRPWYASEFCDRHSLTASQRLDIATQGYCIADQYEKAPEPWRLHSVGRAEFQPNLITQRAMTTAVKPMDA